MNKREMSLYGIFCVVAFALVTWVCIHTWGYEGLLLAGKLLNAIFNLALLGFILHVCSDMSRKSKRGRYIANVQSVVTFWKLEYQRNPIMENGRRIQVDPLIVLLKLTCDQKYSMQNNLPDIGDHELNRYYTSMYIRMVKLIGVPSKMTYQQFTKHMAEYLQVATGYPTVKQDGKGLANMVPEFDMA